TPNGSSNPNRSTALPLPKAERFNSNLWSAGAERSGDPALLLLPTRGHTHQMVPPTRIARRRSLSPRRNDSIQIYVVRWQSAAAPPLCSFRPPSVIHTKRFLQPESLDGAPSPQGGTIQFKFMECGGRAQRR